MRTKSSSIDDKDMMDIATWQAYRKDLARLQDLRSPVKVNGHRYRIIAADHVGGLDAYAFEDTTTHAVAVAYAGTDPSQAADILTDAELTIHETPQQLKEAESFYLRIRKTHSDVAVCGNSLGGAEAAYVAVRNPGTTAVTVNPAPVPRGYATGASVAGVRNYITGPDVLHKLVDGGGLSDGIVGQRIMIPGTSSNYRYLVENHMGSSQTGPLYVASMAVPFSLFEKNTIVSAGQYGAKVDVSPGSLLQIVNGLSGQKDELDQVRPCIQEESGKLRDHLASLNSRDDRVRDAFVEQVEAEFAPARALIQGAREGFVQIRRIIEAPQAPEPAAAVWGGIVLEVCSGIEKALSGVDQALDVQIRAEAKGAWDHYHDEFLRESEVISRGLIAEGHKLAADMTGVETKWSSLMSYVSSTRTALLATDSAIASAIAGSRPLPGSFTVQTPPWPATHVDGLVESAAKDFCQKTVARREAERGRALHFVARTLALGLEPVLLVPLGLAIGAIGVIEVAVLGASGLIQGSALLGAGVSVLTLDPVLAVMLVAFQQEVADATGRCIAQLNEVERNLLDVVAIVERLPNAVDSLNAVFDDGFFSDAVIEDAYNAYIKCRNLMERSAVSFGEVHYQLAGNSAAAIAAIGSRAHDVESDLKAIGRNISEMVS